MVLGVMYSRAACGCGSDAYAYSGEHRTQLGRLASLAVHVERGDDWTMYRSCVVVRGLFAASLSKCSRMLWCGFTVTE